MSDISKRILGFLMRRGRYPWAEVARQLGVDESTVRYHVRELEKSGVIVGYKARVDYPKAGMLASITGLDVEPERLLRVLEELAKMEEVHELYLTTGDHTVMAVVVAESRERLAQVHDLIASLPGVRKVCPALVVQVIK